MAVEPKTAAERAKHAHAERSLDWWAREDGMAELRGATAEEIALVTSRNFDQLCRPLIVSDKS